MSGTHDQAEGLGEERRCGYPRSVVAGEGDAQVDTVGE